MKTSWFKTMAAACAVSLASLGAFGAEEIKLTTSNHYPWDGTVDCVTELSGLESGETYYGVFTLTAGGVTKVYTNEHLTAAGTYTTPIDCTELFGGDLCTTGAGITVKLYKKDKPHEGVQLWAGGPYFATTNIGAENPQDCGYYFWWGDTVGYTNTLVAATKNWYSVKDGTTKIKFAEDDSVASQTYGKTLAELQTAGFIDSTSDPKLNDAHDAAKVHWGSTWRMMTDAELQKLVDKNVCSTTWTDNYKSTGVKGRIVKGATSGYTDKEIFLPAAGQGAGTTRYSANTYGYYWSSAPDTSNANWAPYLYFGNTPIGFKRLSDKNNTRYYAATIRPVSMTAPVATAGNDTEAASASGTFDVDTREIKDTTLAGAEIIGGETSITLNYSPTSWTAPGAEGSVTITYSLAGESGEILPETTTTAEGTVEWKTPAAVGSYYLYHTAIVEGEQKKLTTQFVIEKAKISLVEVQPQMALNTSVEGVYTNDLPVVKTEQGQYFVEQGANVTVRFQGEPGYFFQEGYDYLPTKDVQATASSDPTEVIGPTPVQGTKCGDAAYYFMDGGAMTLVGSGATTSLPAEFNRDSVTSVTIGDGITSIGADFFFYCPYIVIVTGGKDLTATTGLGSQAFHLCMSLATVEFDCTSDPGIAGAIKYNTYTSSGGQLVTVPTVSYQGSVEVLYGKDKLEDADWTKIGVLSKQPSMYEIAGFHFFQVRVEKEATK